MLHIDTLEKMHEFLFPLQIWIKYQDKLECLFFGKQLVKEKGRELPQNAFTLFGWLCMFTFSWWTHIYLGEKPMILFRSVENTKIKKKKKIFLCLKWSALSSRRNICWQCHWIKIENGKIWNAGEMRPKTMKKINSDHNKQLILLLLI